ncbi:MAG TPA: ferritin family protein, partial [Elusimicrobiota bacterium]|nr:ferritin family protein [Elusimicrobiota bacterium]
MTDERQPSGPAAPSWAPFAVCAAGERAPAPRGLESAEGVGDRLRTAAFAELQAREAFRWAARECSDACEELRAAWRGLAEAEERHLGWLLARMRALGQDPAARPVSAALWDSLTRRRSARDFAALISSAEERGRL